MPPLLEVRGLSTHFPLPDGLLRAVDDVSFSVGEGESLAIVGESGCGKSITAFSLLRLVPPPGRIIAGEILLDGENLLELNEEQMRAVRGNRIGMIFQEPMTALNPVLTIGFQIVEGLRLHRQLFAVDARAEAIALLADVGISDPADRFDAYPHQLSGGMRQRVMIAMALGCRPRLLIADEPTTALDVTIQAQILELLDRLRESRRMGLILITHDLGIVRERTAATVVMYAGRVVERASTEDLFDDPRHPYTRGLLASLPQSARPGCPIPTIQGSVPAPLAELKGCGFCDRCPETSDRCRSATPPLRDLGRGHLVRCWRSE